ASSPICLLSPHPNSYGSAAIGIQWRDTIAGTTDIGPGRPMKALAGLVLAMTARAFTTATGTETAAVSSIITNGITIMTAITTVFASTITAMAMIATTTIAMITTIATKHTGKQRTEPATGARQFYYVFV